MELRTLAAIFSAVFVAELGDKTQLATVLFAANKETSRLAVFAAAALALVLSTAIAVTLGAALAECIGKKTLPTIAGIGFIAIGAWTLVRTYTQ